MRMMTISQPEIVRTNNGVMVQAAFEIDGSYDVLWYEVEEEYRQFLTFERADAFVVGLLFLAIQKGVDITVNCPMSKRLFYSLNTYYIPFIAKVFGYTKVVVFCDELTSEALKSHGGVGTGLSCGVDSFSTIIDHEDAPSEYKITHLTFFNVGSHGSHGGLKARELFEKRLSHVKACAAELDKELIVVDSNLSEILMNEFAKHHTIRNMSVVLLLQKLFNKYYYSSSTSIENFGISKQHPGRYDAFSLNMLSTESVTLYSSCATLSRVEKTSLITNFPIAKKYLNVCVSEDLNCGKCFKCLRTLLTLEILDELEGFSAIFNLESYHNAKQDYLSEVVARDKQDVFEQEIQEAMMEAKFPIPLRAKVVGKLKFFKRRTKEVLPV